MRTFVGRQCLTTRSPQPTLARAPRHYLSPARPGHLQSGPESTGYHQEISPPCSTFDRSTQSLRLESRGPICPQGLQKTKQIELFVISVDSGATPDSDTRQLFFLLPTVSSTWFTHVRTAEVFPTAPGFPTAPRSPGRYCSSA